MDKPAIEIGFGDFEHLGASLFAFSARFEICRDDRRQRKGPNSGRERNSLIRAKLSLIARFNRACLGTHPGFRQVVGSAGGGGDAPRGSARASVRSWSWSSPAIPARTLRP